LTLNKGCPSGCPEEIKVCANAVIPESGMDADGQQASDEADRQEDNQ
jgi:hypothetical protein